MTEAAETILQRRIGAQAEEIAKLKADKAQTERNMGKWQKRATQGRNEIARLTREVEQLRADKRNLTFDINKQRARAEQLAEMLRTGDRRVAEVPLIGAIGGDMVKAVPPTSGTKKGVA